MGKKMMTVTELRQKQERKEKSLSERLGFKKKANLEHFGDLKLLGICAGILLLCAVSTIFVGEKSPMAVQPISAAVDATPALEYGAEEEYAADTDYYDSAHAAGEQEQVEPAYKIAAERTPEEQDRLIDEMAFDIPAGETLIW